MAGVVPRVDSSSSLPTAAPQWVELVPPPNPENVGLLNPPVHVATAAAFATAGTVVADPGQRGPYRVRKLDVQLRFADGSTNRAHVYVPEGDGPFVPAIYTSGLMGNRRHGTGTATQLASWGVVTGLMIIIHSPLVTSNDLAGIGLDGVIEDHHDPTVGE